MRSATLLLLVFFALLSFIKGEKDVIQTSVRSSKKTFQCTFKMIVDGKVVDIEKSKLSCSPSKPKGRKRQNLKIDGKLGSYIVSITINPSKIKTAEFTPKQLPEADDCNLGYTRVCLPNSMNNCEEGMYKYCPNETDGQTLSERQDCNCLPAFTVSQAVSSGVSPLGCGKGCVCLSEEFMQCDNRTGPEDAVLIVAGRGSIFGPVTDTEVFFPKTGKGCVVQKFEFLSSPENPTLNTIGDKTLLCGGYPIKGECYQFTPNSSTVWTKYADLNKDRYRHIAWESSQGLVLMGGDESSTTAEIVNKGDLLISQLFIWGGCGITDTDTDSVIYTGGILTLTNVSRYSLTGLVEELPNLNHGRRYHGCSSYKDKTTGKLVLIVVGGGNVTENHKSIDTTEKYVLGDNSWRVIKPLPRSRIGLQLITLNNKIYIFGGVIEVKFSPDFESLQRDVLEYDNENEGWKKTGGMIQQGRFHHGAALIKADQETLCGAG